MRTTVTIDDALYREVKATAARSGQTVGSVLEEALRAMLLRQGPAAADELPELPTFAGGGLMPGVDLDDNASLQRALDAGEDLDALR